MTFGKKFLCNAADISNKLADIDNFGYMHFVHPVCTFLVTHFRPFESKKCGKRLWHVTQRTWYRSVISLRYDRKTKRKNKTIIKNRLVFSRLTDVSRCVSLTSLFLSNRLIVTLTNLWSILCTHHARCKWQWQLSVPTHLHTRLSFSTNVPKISRYS